MSKNIIDNPHFIESGLRDYFLENPLSFIDIGARGGAHDIVEPIAKITSVLGFEPNQAECARLMKTPEVINPWHTFSLEPIALSSTIGVSDFYEVIEPNNSSLYEPNPVLTSRYNMEKWKVIDKSTISVTTLDHLHETKFGGDEKFGEFIKIDTQGSEYDILKGAERLLKKNTLAILTEVSFCQLYSGQKLFSDVEILLRSYGFSFYGFTAQHYRSCKLLDKREYPTRERLIYGDAIFLKDPLDTNSLKISQRHARVLFLISVVLGLYDFALEIVQKQHLLELDIANKARVFSLIKSISYVEKNEIYKKIKDLYDESANNIDLVNALSAKFAREVSGFGNFDDVMGISPLPKTY